MKIFRKVTSYFAEVMFCLIIVTLSLVLTILKKRAFENIAEKEENASYQHFLIFHNVFFLPFPKHIFMLT